MPATPLSVTYDPATDIGAVRQLTFDVDLTIVPTDTVTPPRKTWTVVFADQEIAASLARWGTFYDSPANVFMCASELCMAMATNRAWLARRLKMGDYERDTKMSAGEMQKQAAIYREIANSIPIEVITDVAWSDPNYARILYNRFIAGN